MKYSNKWDEIHDENEAFQIFYKMEPNRIDSSFLLKSCINLK